MNREIGSVTKNVRAIDVIEKSRKHWDERGFVKKASRLSALKRMLSEDGVNPLLTQEQCFQLEETIDNCLLDDLQDYAQLALFFRLIQKSSD